MENTPSNIRQLNTKHVLKTIIENEEVSRTFISKETGLTKPSVSDIVSNLIANKLVIEKGRGSASPHGGRRPIILHFNPNHASIISLDVSPDTLTYCISNLDGTVATLNSSPLNGDDNQSILNQVKETIYQLFATHSQESPVKAISIAIHGMTLDNVIIYTPNYILDQIDLYQILFEEFKLPIFINNEANLSALGAYTFGDLPESFINISIHYGVGAGIIENGHLITGSYGLVGEIGHSIVVPFGKKCSCGNRGCLEQYVSNPSLMGELAEHSIDIHNIRKEWLENTVCRDILTTHFHYLGIAINNLITMIGPELVTIDSEILRKVPELLEAVNSVIDNKYVKRTKIKSSNLKFNSTILGCIAFASRQLLNLDTIKFKSFLRE